jgi:membrane protease YdiL (CAAX protease family)
MKKIKPVKFKHELGLCALLLFLFFITNNYLGFLLAVTGISSHSLFADILFIFVQAAVFIIIIFAGFAKINKSFKEVFKFKPVSANIWGAIILCSAGFVLLIFYLHFFMAALFRVAVYFDSESSYPNNITAVISTALIPAVAEELLFKGIILTGLRRHYSRTVSIVITSLLFAVSHLTLYRIIPLFLVQYFTIWIYLRTGSLLLPMFMHFLNNFFALFLIGDPFASPATFLAAQLVFIVPFVYLQSRFAKMKRGKTS